MEIRTEKLKNGFLFFYYPIAAKLYFCLYLNKTQYLIFLNKLNYIT